MKHYIFKNQILFSKKIIEKEFLNLKKITVNSYFMLISKDVPTIKLAENAILYGWAWNCKAGEKVGEEPIRSLSINTIIEEINDFSGRFIIILDNKYLITDGTSSFPIYYTEEMFSTNISLLSDVNDLQIKTINEYRKNLILPPSTNVKGVKRLIPGEYLDLTSMKSISIENYLNVKKENQDISYHIDKISQYLVTCGKGLEDMCQEDYRLMFTGGRDSRLSFLALYKSVSNKIKTLTHSKPYFFDTSYDINVPKKISKILNFSHQITKTKKTKFDLNELQKHSPYLSFSREPGSTFFYYKHGNWDQIEEKFIIDNYYEIGRMHLHGKGSLGNADKLTYDLLIENGFLLDKKDYEHLNSHMKKLSIGVDKLDRLYFIKNYINVANNFEFLDYSHTVLMYCNSINFFKMVLSVPDKYRANGKLHDLLIERMNISKIDSIPCNHGSRSFKSRLINKIKSIIMKKVYKT